MVQSNSSANSDLTVVLLPCNLLPMLSWAIGTLGLKQLQLRIVRILYIQQLIAGQHCMNMCAYYVGKSVMCMLNTLEYIGCYSTIISGDAKCSENN